MPASNSAPRRRDQEKELAREITRLEALELAHQNELRKTPGALEKALNRGQACCTD